MATKDYYNDKKTKTLHIYKPIGMMMFHPKKVIFYYYPTLEELEWSYSATLYYKGTIEIKPFGR